MAGNVEKRSDGGPFESVTRRTWRLAGNDAADWFAENGLPLVGAAERSTLQLVVDEIRGGAFTGRRIWHTAAAMRCSAQSSDGADTLVLQIDGSVDLRYRDLSVSVTPNDVVIFGGSDDLHLEAQAPSARFEVTATTPTDRRGNDPLLLPASVSTPSASAFASVMNAVMNAEPQPAAPVLAALQRAVQFTIDALILERFPRRGSGGSGERLFHEAQAFVQTWGHAPALSVASVADAMHVSRQHLTQIFADRSTTVGTEIRRHRSRLARRLLASGFMDAGEVAAASGFPSVPAMRRALRGTHPAPDDAG